MTKTSTTLTSKMSSTTSSDTTSTASSSPLNPTRKPSDFPLPHKQKTHRRKDKNNLPTHAALQNTILENERLRAIIASRLDELKVPKADQNVAMDILLSEEKISHLTETNKKLAKSDKKHAKEEESLRRQVLGLKALNRDLTVKLDEQTAKVERNSMPDTESEPSMSSEHDGFKMTEHVDEVQKMTTNAHHHNSSVADSASWKTSLEEIEKVFQRTNGAHKEVSNTAELWQMHREELNLEISKWAEESSASKAGQEKSKRDGYETYDWNAWHDEQDHQHALRDKEEELEELRASHAAEQAAWMTERQQLLAALASKDAEKQQLLAAIGSRDEEGARRRLGKQTSFR